MNFPEFKELLFSLFSANALPIPNDEEAEKLFDLTNIMLETNKKMNLTAIKDIPDVILKHYVDSLTISSLIPEGANLIDVGCGAGFPSLPLAIFRKDINITPLDSTAKRIEYVRSTAKSLSLDNISPIAARAEDLATDKAFRESFDFATARAVAALPILAELCLPFVRIGGSFIAMKAARADEELSAAKNAISKCGGLLRETMTASLISGSDEKPDERKIFVISKAKSTPKEFPRPYAKILKKPL